MSETTTEALPTDVIEQISAAVHEQWMATKHAQGVTSRLSESGEELMVPYPELSEAAKDLDRGSVTAVLGPAYPLITEQIRVEERRRVAGLIRKNAATLDSFAREGSTAGLIAYLIDNVMAADVPVVTPPEPKLPHSRACGWREHPHGPQCAVDCPTCSAGVARYTSGPAGSAFAEQDGKP